MTLIALVLTFISGIIIGAIGATVIIKECIEMNDEEMRR